MGSENITLSRFFNRTIKFYINLLLTFLKGLKKYWFVSVLLLLIVGGLFLYKSNQVHSFSEFKIGYTYNCLNKKYYGDILHDLERSVASKDFNKIGALLNIKKSLASSILSLEGRNIINSKLHEDYTEEKLPFYVHLKVLYSANINAIQKALTAYLQDDEFSRNKMLERNTILIKDSLKIDKELNQIKDLMVPEATDLRALIKLRSELLSEKNRLALEIKTDKNINLLKQYEPFEVTKKSQLISLGLKFGLLYLFLVFVSTTLLILYKNEK